MLRSGFLPRGALLAALSFAAFIACGHAEASKLKIVHSFCLAGGCNGGGNPGGILHDSFGNIFGVTEWAGGRGVGSVYELVGGKKLKILHAFPHDGSDGMYPFYALVMDVNGNLYGTAPVGGAYRGGDVFELSPPAPDGKKWAFRVLYSFCAQQNCADGSGATSGLTYAGASSGALYDGVSPLYGETGNTLYQLVPDEKGWTESVLYTFCSGGGQCADGASPRGGLYVDGSGNLFGTTAEGGNGLYDGVAFELAQNNGTWQETVLYNFCSQNACKDGAQPNGALVRDAAGNLFGTTISGGKACNSAGLNGATCGVIFQLTPSGGTWQESVLYTFCAKPDCKDGAAPQLAGLSIDASGALFGSTFYGGGNDIDQNGWGGGVVFRYSNGSYNVLHQFCSQASCADGEYPAGGLIPDGTGDLLGTTIGGGPDGGGEVFRLTP